MKTLRSMKSELFRVHHFHWEGMGYDNGSVQLNIPKLRNMANSGHWKVSIHYDGQKAWKSAKSVFVSTIPGFDLRSDILANSIDTHWDYSFLFFKFFLQCTIWSLEAILIFPKNAVLLPLGLIAHAPYGLGIPKKLEKVH